MEKEMKVVLYWPRWSEKMSYINWNYWGLDNLSAVPIIEILIRSTNLVYYVYVKLLSLQANQRKYVLNSTLMVLLQWIKLKEMWLACLWRSLFKVIWSTTRPTLSTWKWRIATLAMVLDKSLRLSQNWKRKGIMMFAENFSSRQRPLVVYHGRY